MIKITDIFASVSASLLVSIEAFASVIPRIVYTCMRTEFHFAFIDVNTSFLVLLQFITRLAAARKRTILIGANLITWSLPFVFLALVYVDTSWISEKEVSENKINVNLFISIKVQGYFLLVYNLPIARRKVNAEEKVLSYRGMRRRWRHF